MTRPEIDALWQQALHDSVKDGEMFTRYHFAKAVIEMCLRKAVYCECTGMDNASDAIRAMKVDV